MLPKLLVTKNAPVEMKRCSFLFLILLLCPIWVLYAQDFSNKGKDFWIAYPAHIDAMTSRMALYISATENTTGEVQLDGKVIPFTVTANQATTVQISLAIYNVYNNQADGIGIGKGIHVISVKPVVVYSHILNAARSGSTLVFPTNVLGKEYISLNYTQIAQTTARSQIAVVATEDNTVVEINLKAASSSNPVRSANVPYQVTMAKGDVYQIQSTQDLTGSTIRSISSSTFTCKPIAVFTGSSWTGFCSPSITTGNGGDNLFQQVFPSNAWGRNYITAPFAQKRGDLYRIIVKDPSTVVNLNGTVINTNTLKQNSFYDFASNQPNIITSDKPILVVQYMTSQSCDAGNIGDPEIVTINPLEQTINNVSVVSARRDLTPPNTNITAHYLNVLMKTANIGSLRIDGTLPTANWVTISNSIYSYLQENVTTSTLSNPSHTIKADSGFIALAYGMGNVESYGYNAGTNIVDLNPPVSIQNELAGSNVAFSATCSNTNFKINLSLTYQPKSIAIDFGAATSLTGPPVFTHTPNYTAPNLGYDSTYTSNGKTYYLYRIPQTYSFGISGTYPIKITTTSDLPQSDGCSNTNVQDITENILVNAPPVANFSFISNGCENTPINFTDATDGLGRTVVKWLWEFSDGTTSALQNPSKSFTSGNNYTTKLTSITDFGCVATTTKPMNVSAKPLAIFTIPTLTCANSNIKFTDGSSVAPGLTSNTLVKWTWDLADGAGLTSYTVSTSPTAVYTSIGYKRVTLVVESNTGCVSDTLVINSAFNVNAVPEVGFIVPEVCLADASAPFIDTTKIVDGTQAQFKWAWKLNDGVTPITPGPNTPTSNVQNPAPKYNTVGNYTVSLQVTSNNGCKASLSKPFTVNGSIPNASFNVKLQNPLCSNDSVQIINTSTVDFGTVTRLDIFWDTLNKPLFKVPDENPSLNKQYAIKYNNFTEPDSIPYTISLIAFSGNSSVCSKSVKKIIYVKNSPAVSFTDIRDICYDAAPRQLSQGSFVSKLTATASYFGKGISTAGLLNPKTTGVGNDTLKYFVQNVAGCKDSAFQPLTVWPSPIAKWGVSNPTCEKNNIPFTDSSVANFSKITQWKWNYGNGVNETRTSAALFTRNYTTAQNYTVQLQVLTDSGCISTINEKTIKVNSLPIPAFSLPIICLPDGRGIFTNQTTIADNSGDMFTYKWNFGDPNDNTPSLLKEPTHKYIAVGPYNVQLKVTSKDGCVDSLTQQLKSVYPWPKANFTATPNAICLGDSIRFTDMGNGMSSIPVRWLWDLSGGTTSTQQNPLKIFRDSGTFTISYFFYNAQGCVSDTISKSVIVHPYPKLILGPKINVLEGGTATIRPQYVYGNNLSYLWTPATYLNNPTDSVPKTTPLGDITYELFLTGIGGCTVSDTIFIKLLLSPLVPNAFSPNGDGINDRWRIQYLESYPGATVEVFNRYGQLVFNSTNYSVDWDGKVNGKVLPIGTYYYIINPKNGRKIISGSVTIIL